MAKKKTTKKKAGKEIATNQGGRQAKDEFGLIKFDRMFADLYLADSDRNAKRVYLDLRPKVKERTAEVNASRLLRKAEVSEYIRMREAEVSKKVLDRYEVSEENIVRELALMGFTRLNEIFEVRTIYREYNEDGKPIGPGFTCVLLRDEDDIPEEAWAAIKKLKNTQYGIEVELHDRKAVLELLGKKHDLGLWKDRISHDTDAISELMDEIREARQVGPTSEALLPD